MQMRKKKIADHHLTLSRTIVMLVDPQLPQSLWQIGSVLKVFSWGLWSQQNNSDTAYSSFDQAS